MARRRDDLVTLESAFRALGDATRLRMLHLLGEGEICVCHVHGALDISQPKASRHLAYLRRAGLVTTRRAGTWIYYRLSPAASAPLVRRVIDAATECLEQVPHCAKDRQRLRNAVSCAPAPDCLPGERMTRGSHA